MRFLVENTRCRKMAASDWSMGFLAELAKAFSPNYLAGFLGMANRVLVSAARSRDPDWG